MTSTSVLSSAITSASYNMVLQLFFRLLTFFLNALVLRYISKDMLGVVNVRLTLLYLTTQLLSREAFRRSCLSKITDEKNWSQTINLLWMVVPIGMVWSSLFGYIWMFVLEQPDSSIVPNYTVAVLAFAASTVIEMLSEPLYVTAQLLLFVKLKVFAEGTALACRSVLTMIFVLYYPQLGLFGFAFAQVFYTLCITFIYYAYFTWYLCTQKLEKDFPFQSVRDFFPKFIRNKIFINYTQASLTWSFFKQSFLKQLLTDGEKYIMTVFSILSFGDQGIFDVITNLGSLVARFIFLPIEDSSYLFFSQTLTRGLSAKQQAKESMSLATSVFQHLLKFMVLLGLIILVFGYAYSFLLLDIYGGSVLSSYPGPTLLRWFCIYVLLLAVNGITECFAFATMTKNEVDRYNHKMLLFSIVFLVSSWFFTKRVGSVGFIFANCLNMTARIIHSIYHANKYYSGWKDSPLQGLKPSFVVILILILSFGATSISEKILCCEKGHLLQAAHVGVGALCLMLVLASVILYESNLVTFIKSHYRDRLGKKKEQ